MKKSAVIEKKCESISDSSDLKSLMSLPRSVKSVKLLS